MPSEFFRTLRTDLAEIPALAEALSTWAEQAGLDMQWLFAANLALEELIGNTIIHGFGGDGQGTIALRVVSHPGHIAFELRDNAPPFDPFQVPPPDLSSDVDARRVGGLGVHFVRSMMDEWAYARENGENVVRLVKRLQRGVAP